MLISKLIGWPLLYNVSIFNQVTWEKRNVDPSTYDIGVGLSEDVALSCAFCWSGTLEGGDFWSTLSLGHISEAKEMYPHLFEVDNNVRK